MLTAVRPPLRVESVSPPGVGEFAALGDRDRGTGSEIADAAPACSGGAAPTIRSVPNVTAGTMPSENTTDPATRTARSAD